jgi:hypothetical protein
MATTFPATLDTATTLYDAINNATSTLSGSHTSGGTTIDLVSAALFPSTGGIIYVGNERTTYTGKTSNQLTGMAVLSNNYAAGVAVAMYVDAEHHNTLREAAVAIETIIGATGSVVAGTVTKRLADLEAASSSVEAQIVAAAAKVTPVDADSFGIVDSAGANALKELTWANVKATLVATANTWTAVQTFVAPVLGAATATSYNGMTVTSSTGTFTLTNAKTLAVTNTLTLSGTDSTVMTFPPASASVGYLDVPQVSETTSHTFALSDAGKHIYITGTATLTIPTNASVAFPVGTALTFINNAAAVTTFTTTSLTVYKAGTSAAWASGGTLSIRGMCTFVKVATDTWFVNGNTLS